MQHIRNLGSLFMPLVSSLTLPASRSIAPVPSTVSLSNSGCGLSAGFMAYCSSSNPFFFVDRHKRMYGDAGNKYPAALPLPPLLLV
jgi:hypothetical protein